MGCDKTSVQVDRWTGGQVGRWTRWMDSCTAYRRQINEQGGLGLRDLGRGEPDGWDALSALERARWVQLQWQLQYVGVGV